MRELHPDSHKPPVRASLATFLLLICLALVLRTVHTESPTAGREAFPAGAPVPSAPDLVLVTIDSLRADHVGAYGHSRATTLNLDRLARRGALFERAYAQAPHTSFSISSLMTGRHFGTLTRLVPEARFETLAERLTAHGWTCAAVYPPAIYFADAQQLEPYRRKHFGFSHVVHEYLGAEATVDAAIRFFREQRPRRAFAWIHLFEPHEPYEHRAGSTGGTDQERYDQEIATGDAALGRLLSFLQAERPGALVVITSDHGESFGEHGEHFHGTTLHEEQIRVPLVVAGPGVLAQRLTGPVQLIDLFPTLTELLGVPAPHDLDGWTLAPVLRGQAAPTSRAAFSALPEQRTIIRDHEKLIWDLRHGTSRFFDLRTDPTEQREQAKASPGAAARLRAELYEWIEATLHDAEQLRVAHAGVPVPSAVLRARLGDAAASEGLIEIMATQPFSERQEAAQLLLRLPPAERTLPRLLSMRHHRDPLISAVSRVAALRLGHRTEIGPVWMILRDPAIDYELRLRAGLTLAHEGEHGVVSSLLTMLADCPTAPLCREVIRALGALRDHRATGALLGLLPNILLQREVLSALGALADPASIAPVTERLLHDERVPVRIEAARALAGLVEQGARPALELAARTDPEPVVRDAAVAAQRGPAPSEATAGSRYARRRPAR